VSSFSRREKLYVSWYSDELRIFDISDPTAPQEIGFYRERPHRGTLARGVHKFSRVQNPSDLQEDRTDAPHAHVEATHRLATPQGTPLWTVGGHYDYGLRRAGGESWRISAVTFTTLWASGNRTIMQLAVEKAGARTDSRGDAPG
jgi:hypothetical protein